MAASNTKKASNIKKKSQSSKQGQIGKRTTSSAKKTTSRGKTKKKSTTSSDWLIKLLLVVGVIAIVALLIGFYKQDKEKETGGIPSSTPTPTVAPTLTMTPVVQLDANVSVTPVPTAEAEPTKAVTATQAPTQTPTKAPTPTEELVKQITAAEALTVLRKEIDETTYTISMLNDHLMLGDGKEYYMFCISDATGDLEPLLLVEKETGVIKCYTLEGVLSDFSGFPLDKVETPEKLTTSEISKEKALELLKTVSKEKLGLAKELSEYDEVTYDDWTTMVNGNACYSLNVFELSNGKMRLRGTYYVSLDGSKLYKLDGETNEFIPLN